MKIEPGHIRHIYFLGIGGIGMSALARYFKAKGIAVSGYDKTSSDLTRELTAEGISVHYDDNPSLIPSGVDLVIFTPAIPADLEELRTLIKSGIPVIKRSQAVGFITRGKKTIAVAGSHGKTSISALIAHILVRAGYPVTALIGGISRNYETNYITTGLEEIMLVEADEFDRSFLELEPDIAVISAMDADHLDIYGSAAEMVLSFTEFAARIKQDGKIIIRHDLEIILRHDIHRIGYSVDASTDVYAMNLRAENGTRKFDILGCGYPCNDISLAIPGRHNVENAVAAAAVCRELGVDRKKITDGIESFKGVRRRFDVRISRKGLVYIDDYAHHPRELEAFISAVREIYGNSRLTGLFQPHLYSRTKDFADGFAASMDLLDEPWLLDIYPARELPVEGVTSGLILEKMKNPNKKWLTREEVMHLLAINKPEIFLTMGAGDIDQLIGPIEKILLP